VEFTFTLGDQFTVSYIREPVSLISTLAKIGGLFAFLKISFILFTLHKWLFTKNLSQEL